MNFVLYTSSTGEIFTWGSCTDSADVEVPVGATLLTVDDPVTPSTHYVSMGALAAYTTEQAAAKAIKKTSYHLWNNGTMAWVDTRTLEEAKAAKNIEINAARWTANRSTFDHGGKTFSCDDLSRSDIEGVTGIVALTGALPAGWPGAWKAVDNTYLTIADVAAWTAFYSAMVAQWTTNFVYSQTLKDELAAATDSSEVEDISW